MPTENPKLKPSKGQCTDAKRRGGVVCISDEAAVMAVERGDHVVQSSRSGNRKREDSAGKTRSFEISKRRVWEAYKRGAASTSTEPVVGPSRAGGLPSGPVLRLLVSAIAIGRLYLISGQADCGISSAVDGPAPAVTDLTTNSLRPASATQVGVPERRLPAIPVHCASRRGPPRSPTSPTSTATSVPAIPEPPNTPPSFHSTRRKRKIHVPTNFGLGVLLRDAKSLESQTRLGHFPASAAPI